MTQYVILCPFLPCTGEKEKARTLENERACGLYWLVDSFIRGMGYIWTEDD